MLCAAALSVVTLFGCSNGGNTSGGASGKKPEVAHRIFYGAVQSSRVNGLAKNISVSVNVKTST
ncbi:MAG TPA: hypothetical protein DDY77_01885 [Clostridiales bacterium]|nr:hypothetical protein [Clostridiales bacterium]